tara:strand:- start:669 stop:968 length:300 start_codon:yes stop_codon:yes gene_type:complete
MMSLIADQSNKEGKAYGQECKEILMCLPRSSPKPPPPTVEEKEATMEREAQQEVETAKRVDARQDVLEENITRKRKGSGRRSLLRGSGGGIGFYNEYDN